MIAGEAARVYATFAWPAIFAAPLLRRAFPKLPDGGAAIARPFGWLVIAWISWIASSVSLPLYGTALVLVASASLVVAGSVVAWLDRRPWAALFRRAWKNILLGEILGLAVFAAFVWNVQWNGDVHPAAERFMDYAILERLSVSKSFPPLDSWMAGKTLQYYYYGYVVMDVLRRLSGVDMRWFFNLAIPGIFSAFCVALWGGGLALIGRRRAAIAAVLGGALFGNFDFVRQIFTHRVRDGRWSFYPMDWFHASRVINGTINEVPAFSVFWGDVHPYFIAFPLVALVATLAIGAVKADVPPLSNARPVGDRLLTLGVLALALGSLFPTNSWDFPTFSAVLLAAIAWPLLPPFAALEALAKKDAWANPRERLEREWDAWIRTVAQAVLSVAILSVVLYLPFHIGFGKQVGRGVRLAQRRSDGLAMMTHFGPWFLCVVGWAICTSKDRAQRLRRTLPLVLTAIGLAIYELAVESYVTGLVKMMSGKGTLAFVVSQGVDHLMLRGLAFVLVIAALWVLLADLDWDDVRSEEGVSRILTCAALGLVLICEFAFVRDFYGGDNERMNTVFKAYIQAWILFGLGGAGLFAASWAAIAARGWRWKAPFVAATAAVSLSSLCFIPLAEYTRSGQFHGTRAAPRPTWDAEELFRTQLPGDARAVDWIRDNLPPDSTLVEMTAHAYEWPSRVATFSGRIGLVGWKNHESGWRNSWDLALDRDRAIQTIYTTPDLEKAIETLRSYGIEYLYVGELERRNSKETTGYQLAKFETLPKAYSNERVTLYRVPPAGGSAPKS